MSGPPAGSPNVAPRDVGLWAATLVALAGGAVVPVAGVLPALLMVIVGIGLARWAVPRTGGRLSLAGEIVLALGTCGAACVLAAVAGRVAGGVFVTVPAAVWGAGAGIVGAAVWPRGRRGAGLAAAVLAVAGALAGIRYERAGPSARGKAVSGPIYGIHPFQTTAIRIDGYGPFDLPLNDYVEPEAHRGYGPEELADAVALALHRIAEIHFADGPAQAYQAFAGATAHAEHLPAVRERLDREPPAPVQPRFVVESGTFGPRSRVEFACPGSRNDPRGFRPVSPMVKMCPDKYASEATAGLGVTGRWAGYTEFRGQARTSLAALFGAARADDEKGRRVVRAERLGWALVVGLIVALAAGRRRMADGIGAAGYVAGWCLVAVVAAGLARGLPATVVWVQPPWRAEAGEILRSIVVVAAVLAAVGWAPAARRTAAGGTFGSHEAVGLAAVLLALSTLWAGVDGRALGWLAPGLVDEAATARARWIAALAGRASLATGLDVQSLEAVVGSFVVLLLLGTAGAAARTAVGRLEPATSLGLVAVTAGIGVGAALLAVFAPRAGGGATLVGVLVGVGLAALATRIEGHGVVVGAVRASAFVAAVAGLATPLFSGGTPPSPVTLGGVVAGAVVAVVSITAGRRRTADGDASGS